MIDINEAFNAFRTKFDALSPSEQRDYLKKMGYTIDPAKEKLRAIIKVPSRDGKTVVVPQKYIIREVDCEKRVVAVATIQKSKKLPIKGHQQDLPLLSSQKKAARIKALVIEGT